MIIKTVFRFFMSALVIVFFLGCDTSQEQEKLRLGTNVWVGYEPFYLAKNKNFYDGAEIDLVELPNSTEVIRGYRNMVLDACALTLDEVIKLSKYDNDFYILLITDFSNGADVLIAKPTIKKLSDIKGKKIGVEKTALGAYILSRILDKAELSLSDVDVLPTTVDEHYNAYKNGEVDAVITFEPVRTKLLIDGGVEIFNSSMIQKEIVDVVIIRKSYLEKNQKNVKKILSAWFKALEHIHNNKKGTFELISKRLGISPDDTKKAYEGIILPDVLENKNMLFGKEPKLLKNLEMVSSKLVEAGMIKDKFESKNIFLDSKYIKLYP